MWKIYEIATQSESCDSTQLGLNYYKGLSKEWVDDRSRTSLANIIVVLYNEGELYLIGAEDRFVKLIDYQTPLVCIGAI